MRVLLPVCLLRGEERLVLGGVVVVALVVGVLLLVVVVVQGVVRLGLVGVHIGGLGHRGGGHQVGGVGVGAGVSEDTAWNNDEVSDCERWETIRYHRGVGMVSS